MGNYFESIKSDVQSAIEKAIVDILGQVDENSIYSMALVTDSDFITLYLAANTEEYMKEKDLMYLEDMADFYSAEDINSVKEGICSLTKWIPAEWGYSDDERASAIETYSASLLNSKDVAERLGKGQL